jgi:hypothetical protein
MPFLVSHLLPFTVLPHLASKHIEPIGMIIPQVREVPEEKQRRKMMHSGRLPFEKSGYYCQ